MELSPPAGPFQSEQSRRWLLRAAVVVGLVGLAAAVLSSGVIGRFSDRILDYYLAYYESFSGERASGNHDALALAVATGLVKTTLSPLVDVHVNCSDGEARGRTVTTLEGAWGQWPEQPGARHRVVMEVEPGFEERMIDLLAGA